MNWNFNNNYANWNSEISNEEEKINLARKIAEKVKDGDVIGFGSGSTSFLTVKEIAKKAHESKTGARNLRKLVRESLSHAYDEILTGKDIKVLKLTKNTAIDSKKYYTE